MEYFPVGKRLKQLRFLNIKVWLSLDSKPLYFSCYYVRQKCLQIWPENLTRLCETVSLQKEMWLLDQNRCFLRSATFGCPIYKTLPRFIFFDDKKEISANPCPKPLFLKTIRFFTICIWFLHLQIRNKPK